MFEWMAFISIVLFAAGYFIGRESAAQERTEEEIRQLEMLSEHYRPIIQELNSDIDRIHRMRPNVETLAGLQ